MKKITWVIFLCAFILFRPYQLQSSGMLYHGDDESYMAHATSIIFFQFPSYAKESFSYGKGIPAHSIGPSLLATPFIFVFSIIDRISGNTIAIQRTPLNVSQSWSVFGFTISSLFYLWLTCLLLYRGLRLFFTSGISSLAVMLSVLAQGIPLFALRRPAFTHIYEIFLQSLFLFFMFRLIKLGYILPEEERLKYWKESILVGIVASFVCLVRLNNLFIALSWPFILFSIYYPSISWARVLRMSLVSWLFILAAMIIFVIWPMNYNLHHAYASDHPYFGTLLSLLTPKNLFFYLKRFWNLLFGIDFGLIFSAPYLLLGFISFAWVERNKVYTYLLILLIPLLINFYMVLHISYIGAWYGYRYLIFSLLPVVIYPLAYTLYLMKHKKWTVLFYIILLLSILPVLSMISFEGNNSNLTLKVIDQGYGVFDWGNNTYQVEIYKTILTSPVQYLTYILKGGVCYFIYLSSILLKQNNLPAVIYEKYNVFQLATLIKTVIVYIFPFLLLFVYNKLIGKRKGSI